MGVNNIAIVYYKEKAYRIDFWYMSKDDAINIMTVLPWLIKDVFYNFFLLYLEMSENINLTYYQRTRGVIPK